MSFLFGGGVKTTTRADKIASFQSTACDFGTPLPIAYGTCKLAPNLINFQNYTTVENRTTVKTGKHSSSTSIDYNYYVYLELALCEGVIDGIGKVYSGDDTFASLAAFNANAGNSGAPLSLNRGDNDKPTTYMQSKYPDLAVGYKNMAYLFGYVFLGTNSAGMPSYNFEVQGLLRQSGDGVDANPADIIIDLLKRIGHEEYIDTESFNNYRRYCAAADLLVSTPSTEFSEQKKCQEYIKELLDITNAYMFWSTNRFKIVPRDDRQHGSWRPDATIRYNITERDMAVQANGACVIYTRKDSSELYNRWSVEFTNRANGYEKEKVFFEDTDNIRAHGVRTAPNFSALWIHTKARAVVVAAMRARINKTEIIRYNFKIGWGIGSLLEPGDLITISDASAGIKQQLCMVEKISEDSIGMLTITALSRNLDDSGITYIIPESTYNTIKYNVEPGDVATPLIITPPQDLVTSSSGIEIWLAIQGQSQDWGGCDVYASTKDGAYTFYNKHKHNSNYGYILTDMSADASSVDVKFTNIGTVSIIEGSAENAADMAKSCIKLLEGRYNIRGKGLIQLENFTDYMTQINSVLGYITIFVVFVAAISLLVGGIGVMNIMLVSVTERTREIGIRKSLGARTSSIMTQFLSESAIISLTGGVIGIIIGVLGAFLVCMVIGFAPHVSVGTVLGATFFSSAVGIFFGIYPAKKAAKLSPIEALRHE